LRHLLADGGDLFRCFVQRVVAFLFLGDVEKKPRLLEIGAMLFPGVNDALERRLLPQDALSFFRVVPEIRLRRDLIQCLDPLLLAVDVKDASAGARAVLPGG
jgi:hypothetical protein